MNVAKRHIEGMTTIPAAAGATATRSIMIPLLPANGSWVITGTVQALRADATLPPVTFFPRFTGMCVNGIAALNSTGEIPTEPVDGGEDQRFEPSGLALAGGRSGAPARDRAHGGGGSGGYLGLGSRRQHARDGVRANVPDPIE